MGVRTPSVVGKTFYKLSVLKQETHGKHLMLYVKCECGNEKWVRHASVVKKKDTKSCGCWRDKWDRKRGQDPRVRMFLGARERSKKKNMEFTITKEDIIIPDKCPLLGIDIIPNAKDRKHSPSLDRIDSNRGYTPDNIWVVSSRANTLKNDATLQELELLVENLKCSSCS
jgi:hypothetical protein